MARSGMKMMVGTGVNFFRKYKLDVTIKDNLWRNNSCSIKQNSTQMGIKNLGVHLAPHGNLENERKCLKAKATQIRFGFRKARFTVEELHRAYFMVLG